MHKFGDDYNFKNQNLQSAKLQAVERPLVNRLKNPCETIKHYMIYMKQKFFSEKYAREFEDCMHI